MKFSPTATLALMLAGGVAGAAMAQSTAAPGISPANPQPAAQNVQATWQPGASHPSFAPPQAATGMTQPGGPQARAAAPAQAAQPAAGGEAQVREAQQQLHAAGLYNGPTDGMMDPDTRAALARFQQQNGLPRTERLDRATVARLDSGTTGSGTSTAAVPSPAPNAGTAPPPPGAGGSMGGQPTHR